MAPSGASSDVFGYCEFYAPQRLPVSQFCGAFPCRRAAVHMSKQHDLDGLAELDDDALLVPLPRPRAVRRAHARTGPALFDAATPVGHNRLEGHGDAASR